MPLRKLREGTDRYCRDPEHAPPQHIVLEPGLWEHECPSCKRKIRFRVERPMLEASKFVGPAVVDKITALGSKLVSHELTPDARRALTVSPCGCTNGCKAWECTNL